MDHSAELEDSSQLMHAVHLANTTLLNPHNRSSTSMCSFHRQGHQFRLVKKVPLGAMTGLRVRPGSVRCQDVRRKRER